MTNLIVWVGLPLLVLLIGLLTWLLRNGDAFSANAAPGISNVLASVDFALPRPGLARRIFDERDWKFVSSHTSPEIQSLFLKERKMLAKMWLDETVQTVRTVMSLYRKAARRSSALQPIAEARLALDYGFFLLVCHVLRSLIHLFGPYVARTAVGYAASSAEYVSARAANLAVRHEQAGLRES